MVQTSIVDCVGDLAFNARQVIGQSVSNHFLALVQRQAVWQIRVTAKRHGFTPTQAGQLISKVRVISLDRARDS